jgi:conjugal transfer pilus assembly protein TraB
MSDAQTATSGSGDKALERARRWFAALPEKKRQNLVKAVLFGVGLIAILWFYGASKSNTEDKKPKPRTDVATISLGDSRLEDDLRAQVEKERTEFRTENQQQTKDLNEQRAKVEATEKQLEIMTKALQAMNGGGDLSALARDGKAPNRGAPPDDPGVWEAGSARSGALPAGANNLPPAAPIPVTFVGDIGVAAQTLPVSTGSDKAGSGRPPEQGGKKNTRKFFLPVSFMPAKLLTGLKAKTVDAAKEDPEPMLLRVQAPAVLPNEVRAQLQGCFIVAHGYGSLASERVESRLVSLSCVDFDGRSIIEQEITGVLVDKDGVKGLAGHPVTKMGANISRMFVAGLVEGAGEAFEQSSMTMSTSPIGQIQTIDPDRVGQAGLGRGLAKGAGELSKIYADLVRQSAPVVEVGPGKEVAAFLTQGVWLEVQEYEQLAGEL